MHHMTTNIRPDVPATRDDYSPFDQAAILLPVLAGSAPFIFLTFVRWTSYACPHCEAVFRRDFWPANVRLGNGIVVCKKCGASFDDGSREWPQLAWGKRLRYFLPPGIQAVAGGGLFCFVFTLFIAPAEVLHIPGVLFIFLFFLSPVLLWSLLRYFFVYRSIQRFQESTTTTLTSNVHI